MRPRRHFFLAHIPPAPPALPPAGKKMDEWGKPVQPITITKLGRVHLGSRLVSIIFSLCVWNSFGCHRSISGVHALAVHNEEGMDTGRWTLREKCQVVVSSVIAGKDIGDEFQDRDFLTPAFPTGRIVYGAFVLFFDTLITPSLRLYLARKDDQNYYVANTVVTYLIDWVLFSLSSSKARNLVKRTITFVSFMTHNLGST